MCFFSTREWTNIGHSSAFGRDCGFDGVIRHYQFYADDVQASGRHSSGHALDARQSGWREMVQSRHPIFSLLLVFMLLLMNYRQLNALLLGEETAATLGVNLDRFRIFIILFVSLLTGVVVAVSGSIGFVGLIVPHIVRMLVGSNYKLVLPISALIGAIFLVWADMAARMVLAPEEMPIGIITAICGSPFFIWMLRRKRYSLGTVNSDDPGQKYVLFSAGQANLK